MNVCFCDAHAVFGGGGVGVEVDGRNTSRLNITFLRCDVSNNLALGVFACAMWVLYCFCQRISVRCC